MNEVDLYCDVLRARLISQEGLIRDYGTKVGVMLGVGAAMVGAGAVILRLSNIDHVLLYVVFSIMAFAFLVNAIMDAFILRLGDWRTAPGMDKLAPNLGVYEEGQFTKLVGDAFGEAIDYNQRLLDKKAGILQWAIWFLYLEVVALAVLASLSLWLSGQGAFPVSLCPV